MLIVGRTHRNLWFKDLTTLGDNRRRLSSSNWNGQICGKFVVKSHCEVLDGQISKYSFTLFILMSKQQLYTLKDATLHHYPPLPKQQTASFLKVFHLIHAVFTFSGRGLILMCFATSPPTHQPSSKHSTMKHSFYLAKRSWRKTVVLTAELPAAHFQGVCMLGVRGSTSTPPRVGFALLYNVAAMREKNVLEWKEKHSTHNTLTRRGGFWDCRLLST